jgi:hypothetical protein
MNEVRKYFNFALLASQSNSGLHLKLVAETIGRYVAAKAVRNIWIIGVSHFVQQTLRFGTWSSDVSSRLVRHSAKEGNNLRWNMLCSIDEG